MGVVLLGHVLPGIDPRRRNYPAFQRVYWLVINSVVLLIFLTHAITLGSAAGMDFRVPHVLAFGIALLLIVFGNYMGRIRPNWFMGIRTPWTSQTSVSPTPTPSSAATPVSTEIRTGAPASAVRLSHQRPAVSRSDATNVSR